MAEWTTLPYDVHLIILNMAFAQLTAPEEHQAVGGPLKRTHGLMPSHALVCRDWFKFFERETYRAIFVTQASLDNISRFTRRQRSMVRYLWVKIDLFSYGCPDCAVDSFQSLPLRRKVNASLIAYTIRRTLNLLSSWDTEQGPEAPGLTLEFSACSPSDMEHVFHNDLHFDTSPFDVEGPLERNRPDLSILGHGWIRGRRIFPHRLASIDLVAGFSSMPLDELPAVPAVTNFVVRRQTRWHFGPSALAKVVQKLPGLRRVLIESWRQFHWFPQKGSYRGDNAVETDIATTLFDSLPDTVQSLTMFEDFNEDYNFMFHKFPRVREWDAPAELVRTPAVLVGRALARRSQRLQSLNASYMVDARDFFSEAVKPGYSWDHLTVLSLTSRHLNSSSEDTVIHQMLANAGRVALKMPALTRLDIWNGTKGNVCGFRYEVTWRQASIEWHSNRLLSLSADVVRAWERAAYRHTGGGGLLVKDPRIVRNKYIRSHATAMEILGLQDQVLHPVSFRQIACETSRYWFKHY
ncbi:hypothetical protein MAC_09407 [Metarhizium acridum CQMa 102]|uniref:DUF6546 domain-containing protein n=1 Tax=Metarhizium acridum (strain CQMa 102) TaxID=655827 RepID=E9EHQ9_METAQ|nr:uncharacterized protein MAC_09407 [Metarhizium acridum CQMa 102]EFY84561.1 hypothetical protein MAC_09407 [Metarhizium acridum CQMa 102]